MISVRELSKEFEYRHEFNTDDISLLETLYPETTFTNIPEAWVVVLDDMMRELSRFSNVKYVSQYYGFLSVIVDHPNQNTEGIILHTESRLYRIDADLHYKLKMNLVAAKRLA